MEQDTGRPPPNGHDGHAAIFYLSTLISSCQQLNPDFDWTPRSPLGNVLRAEQPRPCPAPCRSCLSGSLRSSPLPTATRLCHGGPRRPSRTLCGSIRGRESVCTSGTEGGGGTDVRGSGQAGGRLLAGCRARGRRQAGGDAERESACGWGWDRRERERRRAAARGAETTASSVSSSLMRSDSASRRRTGRASG